jgi:hypothetical protein
MADVSRRIAPLIEAGDVATTASLDAEALYSARGPAEYEQLWADRRTAYEYLPTDDEHWQTALGTARIGAAGAASSRRRGGPSNGGSRGRPPVDRGALRR